MIFSQDFLANGESPGKQRFRLDHPLLLLVEQCQIERTGGYTEVRIDATEVWTWNPGGSPAASERVRIEIDDYRKITYRTSQSNTAFWGVDSMMSFPFSSPAHPFCPGRGFGTQNKGRAIPVFLFHEEGVTHA